MISAVDLLKGIAICAGMKSVDVEGATGYIDTNFDGKCKAAIDEFKTVRILYISMLKLPMNAVTEERLRTKLRLLNSLMSIFSSL